MIGISTFLKYFNNIFAVYWHFKSPIKILTYIYNVFIYLFYYLQ